METGDRAGKAGGCSGSRHPATDTGGEDEPPSVPGVPRGARQSPAKPRLERGRARFRTYIPPMETVAHVRSEKAGTVSVALLAGRM